MSAARAPIAALLAIFAAVAAPARGNDSEAEIGIGGIVLKPSEAIVMASEDLFISEEIVRVKYRFDNPTDRDVTVTVAFPMPAQPRGMMARWYDSAIKQDWSGFGFSTRVDGSPVRLREIERAMIGGRDVTSRIRELGWPVYWPDENGSSDLFAKMSETDRERFAAEGLAVKEELFGDTLVPAWDAVTFFVREQTVPAYSSVKVEHEYSPIAGGSVGGALTRQVREGNPEIVRDYRNTYCTDAAFLAGLDRRLEAKTPGFSTFYSETWLAYVLSSGANWKGPIGDFRLVVDKGSTDNLVSFCMDGVTKIAPTRFEVRKKDFVPKRDLRILIAKFNKIEE